MDIYRLRAWGVVAIFRVASLIGDLPLRSAQTA
jgi:hypothetical protein